MSQRRPLLQAALLAFGLIALSSSGCSERSRRIASGEVVGTYSVTYPFGIGLLRVNSDGSYEQVLRIGGRVASAKGEWQHKEEGKWDFFFFQHCLTATNGFGSLNERWETPSEGACSPSVGRRFVVAGEIEIADDEEYAYRKVSPSTAESEDQQPR